ncbi:MAG TPA: DUF1385 domain-containing protein [Bacillota bacterium]
MSSKFQYGGQAVIEGVMMRGRYNYAVAVRKNTGDLVINNQPLGSYTKRLSFLRWPFIRGIIALGESFALGLKALQFSANQFMEEEGEAELTPWEMTAMIVLALGLTVLLFIVLPLLVRGVIAPYVPGPFWRNLAEGLIRAVILVAYISLVSLMKDIKRIFMYHGAEHKAIHTYEAGEELTVENARGKSTLHPRCGTSFLLFVVITSAVVFSFLGEQTLISRFSSRLLLLPVVAGISYELIKLAGKKQSVFWWKWLSWPGLMLQKLTTREPDDSQLQVAIAALQEVLAIEKEKDPIPVRRLQSEENLPINE